jgi:streptomycin 6-kinase
MQHLADLSATDFAAAGSPRGKAWVSTLPALLDDLAQQWNLTVGEEVWHGYSAVVFPVCQGGRPLALKLAWPADVPRGALLLERLDAARSLAGIPLTEAAAIAGTLVRTLAIRAPGSFPPLPVEARQLATTLLARQRSLQDPVPRRWIALAASLAANLARDPARLLVHADLHYDNILASQRPGQPWVAIDPTAAAGAPERSVAELLWTRADELPSPQAILALLDTLVANAQLDRAKAAAWGFVRSIDYWLWALENGLTTDPMRCRRVAGALAPVAEALDIGCPARGLVP